MRTEKYFMTDDLIQGLCIDELASLDNTLEMIQGLSQEDYDALNVGNIINEIYEQCNYYRTKRNENLQTIDDLIHFNYSNVISYEIQYDNEEKPTGVILVCLE